MQQQRYTPSAHSRAEIEAAWRRLGVHRASEAAQSTTWSTGCPALDRILPGGGYPLAAVTEWLVQSPGIGELSFLLSGLAPRLASHPTHRLVLINPPYRLNAPALDALHIDRSRLPVVRCREPAECVWSIEQLATAGGFIGFILWQDTLDATALRRLQLASEKAGCPVFVYRSLGCARQRSPAALRLVLRQQYGEQRLEILKCRGPAGARARGLSIGRDRPWQAAAGRPHTPVAAPASNDSVTSPMDIDDLRPVRPEPAWTVTAPGMQTGPATS